MDGCSQMVFCTHLSYTADREREPEREERVRTRKGGKQNEVFADC